MIERLRGRGVGPGHGRAHRHGPGRAQGARQAPWSPGRASRRSSPERDATGHVHPPRSPVAAGPAPGRTSPAVAVAEQWLASARWRTPASCGTRGTPVAPC
ncbi:hypothetical protein QJS66_17460 [Kocuria rhizophila]|nr:hypothetical protein QJS66_17460 [Kocuria rhizophila]